MKKSVVRFRNVDIMFGDKPESALKLAAEGRSREEIQDRTGQILGVSGINLDVHEGETLVLMGLSGSGKSTLLRAVNRLNHISRGSIEINDGKQFIDVASCKKRTLRQLRLKHIAMVFQQFSLLPWRSVADNVGFGLELAGMNSMEIAKKVSEQLELVGLLQWADKPVQTLSGGMQQRVGLARAFATDAPILLMDEPYSALDPLIRSHLQDELINLQKSLEKTIIFVSHDLDEAIRIGSRIAIMEEGRIVQLDTPREVLKNPASSYVADFVAHMNPLTVLKAHDAMRKLSERRENETSAAIMNENSSLKQVMRMQLDSGMPVYIEKAGKIIGRIDSNDIHRLFLDHTPARKKMNFESKQNYFAMR